MVVMDLNKKFLRKTGSSRHLPNMPKNTTILILILAISLILRLAHFTEMKSNNPIADLPIVDSEEYIKIAEYILDKNFFGPPSSFWHPPLYYYFIAAIFKILGRSLDAIKLLQIVIDLLNVLMVFFVAKKVFDRTVAIISALLYAAYLPLVYYSVEILPPILIIALLLFSIMFLLKFNQTQKDGKVNDYWLVISGISFGLLIIIQPTFIFSLIFIAIWLVVCLRRQLLVDGRLKYAIILIIISLIPTALVTARNYLIAREPVVISYNGGINFYIGNNSDIYNTLSARPGFEWEKLLMKAYVEERISNFAEQSGYYYRKGFEFILRYPFNWMYLMIKKSLLFFNSHEFPRNFDLDFFGRFSFITKLPIIKLDIILPLGLSAVITMLFGFQQLSNKREIILCLSLFFTYSFTIILFFVVGRYRLPIIPFLIIFAAYYVVLILKRLINKEYLSTLKLILLLISIAVITKIKYFQHSYPYELAPSYSYMQIGRALLSAGKFNQAYNYLQKGLMLPQDKSTYELYYNLAEYFCKTNKDHEAVKYYRKAWQLNPEYYDALNALGFQYKKLGEYDSAIYFLHKAVNLAKWHAIIYFNLADCYLLKNDWQKAIETFESFHKQCPSPHPIIGEGLGKLYMKFSKWELAVRNFEEAIKFPQGYEIPAEIYNLLGICYYRMQQYQKAKKVWTIGLKKDPFYEPIRKNLQYLPD